MNQKFINVLAFTVGAAIGSAVTWKIMKNRCERFIREEVDAFKADWSNMTQEDGVDYKTDTEEDDETEEELDEDGDPYEYGDRALSTYHNIVNRYKDYDEKGGGEEVSYVNGPYVIEPEEFADGNFDHECHCITYYADGVLADDWYVVLDIEETIGEDALEHFGDFVNDVVHVRNERLHADYEVTKDPRNFADIVADDPLMSRYAD